MLGKGLTPLKIGVLLISFIGAVVMITGKLETSILIVYDPDPDMSKDEEDEEITI
jgi:hypothetical protein